MCLILDVRLFICRLGVPFIGEGWRLLVEDVLPENAEIKIKIYFCLISFLYSIKENGTIADLRYGEKDNISPCTLNFAPIKGLLGIYTLHIPPEIL